MKCQPAFASFLCYFYCLSLKLFISVQNLLFRIWGSNEFLHRSSTTPLSQKIVKNQWRSTISEVDALPHRLNSYKTQSFRLFMRICGQRLENLGTFLCPKHCVRNGCIDPLFATAEICLQQFPLSIKNDWW